MFCRNCTNQIDDRVVVCVHCGAPPFAGNKHCQNCGNQTHAESTVCIKCGAQLKRQSRAELAGGQSFAQHEPILMGLTSFFVPGLGQMLLGQTEKGAVMLAVSMIAYGILVVGGFVLLLPCCLIPFVSVFPAIDAFLIATKMQKGISIEEPLSQPQQIIKAELVDDNPTTGFERKQHAPIIDTGYPSHYLPFVSPSELQVRGETSVLFGTLAVAACVFLSISLATAFIFAVLLLVAYIGIRSYHDDLRKTAFRVTAESAPAINALVQVAARRLTIATPELYIVDDRELNANASGFDGVGTVVLNSGIIDAMDSDELMFIIGHELTHIKCEHCKYLAFTNAAVGTAVNHGIALITNLVFKLWSRKAEFTCDRGGLIACKRPEAAMSALAKLEMHDPAKARQFIERAILGDPSVDDWFATHPSTANRIAAVSQYAKTRDYARLTSLWEI